MHNGNIEPLNLTLIYSLFRFSDFSYSILFNIYLSFNEKKINSFIFFFSIFCALFALWFKKTKKKETIIHENCERLGEQTICHVLIFQGHCKRTAGTKYQLPVTMYRASLITRTYVQWKNKLQIGFITYQSAPNSGNSSSSYLGVSMFLITVSRHFVILPYVTTTLPTVHLPAAYCYLYMHLFELKRYRIL